jgi:hypothetical protein
VTILSFPDIWHPKQMTLDGAYTDHPAPTRHYLGPHERAVLQRLAYDSLTSTQAGTICHSVRGHCFSQVPYGRWNIDGYHRSKYGGVNIYPKTHTDFEKTRYRGEGCCPGACLEGTEVMKRLKRRGFVVKIGGLWYAAESWGRKNEQWVNSS